MHRPPIITRRQPWPLTSTALAAMRRSVIALKLGNAFAYQAAGLFVATDALARSQLCIQFGNFLRPVSHDATLDAREQAHRQFRRKRT